MDIEMTVENKMVEEPPKRKPLKKHPKWKYVKNNWGFYLMLLPGLLSLGVFTLFPMVGLYIAFIDYNSGVSIFRLWEAEFVGTLNFDLMFLDPLIWKMIRNTLVLSSLKILVNFPLTIVLALLIYEVEVKWFKNVFQWVSYLPNFISWVIISGMMTVLLDGDNGIFNKIIERFGGTPVSWYASPYKWWGLLVVSGVWKGIGWGTIMYIATMSSIDVQLYEAAEIDGATRLQQTWHVTLPGLAGLISIQLILTIGKIFTDDFEQIYALVGPNDILQETTAVFSTKIFEYSSNIKMYETATAMGFLQSMVCLVLVSFTNWIAKKMGQVSIW
jgi:putative aldouronate transport system permease protein